jgi:hypothetical protein
MLRIIPNQMGGLQMGHIQTKSMLELLYKITQETASISGPETPDTTPTTKTNPQRGTAVTLFASTDKPHNTITIPQAASVLVLLLLLAQQTAHHCCSSTATKSKL